MSRSSPMCARALLFLWTTALSAIPGWAEPPITIGVPELPAAFDVLSSEHPGAELLRRATVGTLRDSASGAGLSLRVADAIEISPAGETLRLRISPLARFSNGKRVTIEDAQYSLGRCVAMGTLPGVERIESQLPPAGVEGGSVWIRLQITPEARAKPEVLQALGRCPILERASSGVFGSDLGWGSNFVSCGEYGLSEIKPGRELSVSRLSGIRSRTQASGADVLTIRGFADGEGALAALRAGTVDAFVTADKALISRANKDETLFALQCPIYTIVHRKGLQIDCLDRVVVSKIRYIG